MLQSIRDKATGWIAYIIVGLISIPFLFWGIQSYLGAGGKRLVAEVNGEEISIEEFQRALQQQQQQLREMFGGKVPAGLIEGPEIKQSVLDNLIRTEVLRQYSQKAGFRVSDAAIVEAIKNIPIFQENGQFNAKKYALILAQQRMDKAAFEHQIRLEEQINQLPRMLTATDFLTAPDKQYYLSLKDQLREFDYIALLSEQFKANIQLTDAEIADYYQTHQDRFMTPERVKASYLILDESELAKSVSISDEELHRFYEQSLDMYRTPEARKVRRILIKVPETANEQEKEALKKKAEDIRTRLNAGEAFDTLAQSVSDDQLSAKQGGTLGWVQKGDFDPAFDAVVFSLPLGTPSEVFEDAQGYEIVEVTELRESEVKPFDAVRAQLERDLRQRKAEKILVEDSEQLLTLTYENPDSLEPAADALGLEIQTTDWFTRGEGAGVAANAAFRDAAFQGQVKNEGQNSDVIELEPGKQLVLRVTEVAAAAPRPLDDVQDEIRAILVEQRAREQATTQGEALLQRLHEAQKSLAESAQEEGLEILSGKVKRNDANLPKEALDKLFKLRHPTASSRMLTGFGLSDGSYWLVELKQVETPEITAEQLGGEAQAIQALADSYARRLLDAVYQVLVQRAEIKLYRESIE